LEYSNSLLEGVVSRHALKLIKHDRSGMGEWYVYFESFEFILSIGRDRGGHVSIELGSKIRRKPRANMRGPWSISHLKGYLDGKKITIFSTV
ncbi:hypothetical protein, partial [uncultured Gimesia sp.]|uniref:hypothetical protein n=1 Tax=uncultured Gimesia sp. TaxID=1678688 RepID=UPI0026300AF2